MLNRFISVVFMCALIGGCSSTQEERLFGFDVTNGTRASVSVRLFDPNARDDMTDSVVVLGPHGQYRDTTTFGKETSLVVRRWQGEQEVGPKLDVPIVEDAMVTVVVGFKEGELVLETVETEPWEW